MDRYDTYVAKINAVDRINHGALNLANEDVALTGLFNGFLRYLLDEWTAGPQITQSEAPALAKQMIKALTLGMRQPTRERLREFAEDPARAPIIPLLAVRWLMRNAEIRVIMPHLGREWGEFVRHYQHVIAALDPKLFSFRDM